MIPFLLLGSCSAEKVLVLNDPGFDFFAEEYIPLYKIRREMFFRLKGYDPDFSNYEPTEDYGQRMNELIEGGGYVAVVTGVASAVGISVPDGVKSVLMGGTAEAGYPFFGQVVSSAEPALRQAGAYLRRRCDEEGLMPLVILYGDGKGERDAILDGWGLDRSVELEDHILVVGKGTADLRKALEQFLGDYDFDSEEHLFLGYCAPVMQELLEILPLLENIKLVLDLPDDSLIPGGAEALIVPDYQGLLREAVGLLAEQEEGGRHKIPYLFLEK